MSRLVWIPAVHAETGRHTENLNQEWVFQLGDVPGAEIVDFDDSSWNHVGLPHSFSTQYFAATRNFYVGYGWYRKRSWLPMSEPDGCYFLNFDGEHDWKPLVSDARKDTANSWTAQVEEGTEVRGRYLRVTLLAWPEGASLGVADMTASGTIYAHLAL